MIRSLLDTHFLLWIVRDSDRLARFPWLERYRPWGVSPISILEAAYLDESGRVEVVGSFAARLTLDSRFEVDDVSLLTVARHAAPLAWTRDPFDRLIAAHSAARRLPLCTTDRAILRNHAFVPAEMRPKL